MLEVQTDPIYTVATLFLFTSVPLVFLPTVRKACTLRCFHLVKYKFNINQTIPSFSTQCEKVVYSIHFCMQLKPIYFLLEYIEVC